MCGIFATTRPALWRSKVPEVLRLLRHRGPDAEGVWESPGGEVLLLHTRLAIIGLGSEGDQPATLASGHAVTFNGEIYNFRELASDLGGDAAVSSDTQTLLRLLARDGAAALPRLRGMYALGWWDATRRSLVAARDPWGIKPLYQLDHHDGGVTLCSELRPLTLLADGRDVDPVGLAQFLAFGHTLPSVTLFERIRKVPLGTALSWQVRDDGLTSLTTEPFEQWRSSPASVGHALDDSVRAHLVADVEVGVFLSGGVDSTLITSYASDSLKPLRTYTISFPDVPQVDESPFAEANARALGTRHRTVPVTVAGMLGALDCFLDVNGEPAGDPAALPLTMLAAEATGDVKVVLTGEGADEMFGGYRRYDVSRHLGGRVLSSLRMLTSPAVDLVYRHRSDRPLERAIEALLRGGARGYAALIGSDLPAVEASCWEGHEVARLLVRDWSAGAGSDGGRDTARRFDLARWLPNTYLEKTDRATMAHSVEARTPFLDPVVAASIADPERPFGKAVLRQLLVERLPGVRLPDRKKGLAVPTRRLLDAGLGEDCRRCLESRSSLIFGLLGDECMRRLAQRTQRSVSTAYRLAVLSRWQERMNLAA